MPYLLDSICTIIGVFYQYAQHHGGRFTLKRREMKRLIQKEFAEVIKNPHDPRTVERMFQTLDANGDGLVDFSEYLLLIFKVAKACYRHLKPREDLLRKEETSTGVHGGESWKNERAHHQRWDDERREGNINKKGDSDQKYLHPTLATAQRQEGRDYHLHAPVTRMGGRIHQAHHFEKRDFQERDHLFSEHQKWEDNHVGSTLYGRQAEVEIHQLAHNAEPQREDVSDHQIKERQPAIREDYQHQSRALQRPKSGEYQNESLSHEALDVHGSLSREHERKPQLCDPKSEKRRIQTYDTERPQSSTPQSRKAEHRADQQDNLEVREAERRRSQFPVQDEWATSYTSQPRRRTEAEDHQGTYASEYTHREERRLHPSEPEPMNSNRRCPKHHETTIEDGKRSPQHEYSRPLEHGQEDHQGRVQYYEPESWERECGRRRLCDVESKQSETETTGAWVIREGVQRSHYQHRPEYSERDLEHRRSPACEAMGRKDNQGNQHLYEPKSWQKEDKRMRMPQVQGRSPVDSLRQVEKERSHPLDLLTRTTGQVKPYPSEHAPRRLNQSREQTYWFDPRDNKRITHQLESEQSRQMYGVPEALERKHQARPMSCISVYRGSEPRGLQGCYPKEHVYQKHVI